MEKEFARDNGKADSSLRSMQVPLMYLSFSVQWLILVFLIMFFFPVTLLVLFSFLEIHLYNAVLMTAFQLGCCMFNCFP